MAHIGGDPLQSRALEGVRDAIVVDYNRFSEEMQTNTSKFLKRLSKEFEARTAEFLAMQKDRFALELHRLLGELSRENLKRCQDVEDARRQLEEDKARMEGVYQFQQSRIKLDVGGFYYSTSLDTLRKDPHSLLAVMFSGRHKLHSEDGRYFIDRNGEYFSYILDFLRDGAIILPANTDVRDQILKEAEYFRIRLHPPLEPGQPPQYYSYSWEQPPGYGGAPLGLRPVSPASPRPTFRPPPIAAAHAGSPVSIPAPAPYRSTSPPRRPASPPRPSASPPPLATPPQYPPYGQGGHTTTTTTTVTTATAALPAASPLGSPFKLLSADGWDRTRSSEFNVISGDLRTLYSNSANSSSTTLLSPGHAAGVHQWDLRINKMTSDVGIGIAPPNVPLNRMIGTTNIGEEGGWCYHSSGNTFMDGHHVEYGDEFGTGDVITIRLDLNRKELSFAKNGRDLGVAFDSRQLPDTKRFAPLHLAVSLFGRDTSITLIGHEHQP